MALDSIEKLKVYILMDTDCAPLVADLILLCHERDVKLSLSDNTQADAIEVPDSTSRYLHGILNIVYPTPFFLGGGRVGSNKNKSTQIQMWRH